MLAACSGGDRKFDNNKADAGSTGGSAGSGASGGTGGGSAGSSGSSGSAGSGGNAGASGSGGTAGASGSAGSGGTAGASGSGGTGGSSCTTSDPDCECVGNVVKAKDADGDGQGSIDCTEAPGTDCDDNNKNFQQNACGGCASLAGAPNAACLQCGKWACNGKDAVKCSAPVPAPTKCGASNSTIEVCTNGNWTLQTNCTGSTSKCLNSKCVQCLPGTFKCGTYSQDTIIYACETNGSWASSWFQSCFKAQGKFCNATTGTCTSLLLPRDHTFELKAPLVPGAETLPAEGHQRTRDVLDLATGFKFA